MPPSWSMSSALPPLAHQTDDLQQSDIRAITQMVEEVDGINLGQGICDLPTPAPLKRSAQQAIEADHSTYSNYAGIPQLRKAILRKARRYNQIPAGSDEEVMVGVGATGTYVTAVYTLLDPGDEVILFEPFYGYHRNILQAVGAEIKYVPASYEGIDLEALANAFTDRTKALVINTPGNPGGKVWTHEELEHILSLLQQHDCYAITDEIYEYMIYDGHRHVSLASLPEAYERTITISGLSKTYNVTGWRLGYAVAPPPLIEKMGLVNDLFYICAPRPLQHGAVEALNMNDSYYEQLAAAYAKRRKLLCKTLEAIGFKVPWPQGAYYVLASFEEIARQRSGFEDAQAACKTLIQEAGVATIPGPSFFQDPNDGRFRLRFCFAKEMPVLKQACHQLRRSLSRG